MTRSDLLRSRCTFVLVLSVFLACPNRGQAQHPEAVHNLPTRVDHSIMGVMDWVPQVSGTTARLNCVHFENASIGFAGGVGTFLRTSDGGKTWTKVDSNSFQRMDFANSLHGVAVNDWKLLTTTDAGSHWKFWVDVTMMPPLSFSSVCCIDADTIWAAGTDQPSYSDHSSFGALWKSTDGGLTWHYQSMTIGVASGTSADFHAGPNAYSFENYDAIAFKGPQQGIVVGSGSSLSWITLQTDYLMDALRTPDGGAHWTRTTTFSDTGGYSALSFPVSNAAWTVGYLRSSIKNGFVRRTTNGGGSWQTQLTLPGKMLNDVSFVDTLHGWVVGDSGNILSTLNGGKTWTVQSSGTTDTLRGVFFVDSLTGWVVGDKGTILKTTNGGGVAACPDNDDGLVSSYSLSQNYPNPFNPTTVISYQLPVVSIVRLVIYDMLGREVSILVNDKKDAGVHEVKFDGSNLACGVYFYRMQAGDFMETRKLLLLH
jgi:photosystem II stability/assembly factor-like uncharacterized protein